MTPRLWPPMVQKCQGSSQSFEPNSWGTEPHAATLEGNTYHCLLTSAFSKITKSCQGPIITGGISPHQPTISVWVEQRPQACSLWYKEPFCVPWINRSYPTKNMSIWILSL
jgi:hypothetical protein